MVRNKDDLYRMRRGDVQFTTGGRGITHSEQNESEDWVHFLQIWAMPWAKGLTPRYYTRTFEEADKRRGFVTIISPLRAGSEAAAEEEEKAEPVIPGTIPIHADLIMSAGIIGTDKRFKYTVGGQGDVVRSKEGRNVYVHLPMTKNGSAKVRLAGREDSLLEEGDGAYVSKVNAGDVISVESVGEAEAELVVLDSQ